MRRLRLPTFFQIEVAIVSTLVVAAAVSLALLTARLLMRWGSSAW